MIYMTAVAVFLMSARIAAVYKRNLADALAVCGAGLVITMYLLSFFRALNLIIVPAAVLAAYVIIRTAAEAKKTGEKRGTFV